MDNPHTMYNFYQHVKEIYKQLVKEIGFWDEYRKGREVPVTIGLIYNEYIKKHGKNLTLEEFFERIKQLARQGLIQGLGVHPLYSKEYIIIRPGINEYINELW